MDALDRAMIDLLRRDARISISDLARRVGLSPSPCLRRLRRLESSGVIQGYRTAIDPVALGQQFEVIVHINMMIKNQTTIEAFERRMTELEEVVSCRRMFGDPDYLIWVAVADADAYERFYMTALTEIRGVGRTNSQFTMKVVKPD